MIPLNIRKFKSLLYAGDRRALDALLQMDDTSEFLDAIVYACSHHTCSADTEDLYYVLYEAVRLTGNVVLDRLAEVFACAGDRKDVRAVCRLGHILSMCAADGDGKARVVIHDRFDSLMSSFAGRRRINSKKLKHDLFIAETMAELISRIDGMAGFLYVAARYGRLMVKKKDACLFFPHAFWEKAKAMFGTRKLLAIMEEYFDKMEYLRAFYMSTKA